MGGASGLQLLYIGCGFDARHFTITPVHELAYLGAGTRSYAYVDLSAPYANFLESIIAQQVSNQSKSKGFNVI